MDRQVTIRVSEDGGDDQRVDSLTRDLRAELLQLDVDDVRLAPRDGAAPDGSRGGGGTALGELVVAATASAPLMTAIGQVVVAWLHRGGQRSAQIVVGDNSLTLDGVTPEQQDELVRAFVRSVSEG